MIRFKRQNNPSASINTYLRYILIEAKSRKYNFDRAKLRRVRNKSRIEVSAGQLSFEFKHLKRKLRKRNPEKYREIRDLVAIDPHPLFIIREGGIEGWEKL